MISIKTYLNSLGRTTRTIILALAVIFVSAGIAQAATTISTNILTGGTLGVTGLSSLGQASTTIFSATGISYFGGTATSTFSAAGALNLVAALTGTSGTFSTTLGVTGLTTLSGGATTTQVTFLSGDTIKNASASTTAISGSVTADANVTLLNAQAATSTLTAACVVTTATSSATKIRLMFNTSATTTTLNGNTVQGVVLWGYGSSCAN